jgi:hypothetical protein
VLEFVVDWLVVNGTGDDVAILCAVAPSGLNSVSFAVAMIRLLNCIPFIWNMRHSASDPARAEWPGRRMTWLKRRLRGLIAHGRLI